MTCCRTLHLQVGSFGVGAHVKLPGPSQKEPNVYKFGTPYKEVSTGWDRSVAAERGGYHRRRR